MNNSYFFGEYLFRQDFIHFKPLSNSGSHPLTRLDCLDIRIVVRHLTNLILAGTQLVRTPLFNADDLPHKNRTISD